MTLIPDSGHYCPVSRNFSLFFLKRYSSSAPLAQRVEVGKHNWQGDVKSERSTVPSDNAKLSPSAANEEGGINGKQPKPLTGLLQIKPTDSRTLGRIVCTAASEELGMRSCGYSGEVDLVAYDEKKSVL